MENTKRKENICPILSAATIIRTGELQTCLKECGFARHEGKYWWCALTEIAHCAEYVEKEVRGYL